MDKNTRRKLRRLENKKKKIIAFLEVAKLNEEDRKVMKMKLTEKKMESGAQSEEEDSPLPKKSKVDDSLIINNGSTNLLHEEVGQDSDLKCPDLTDPSPNHSTIDIEELKRLLRERRKRLLQMPRFSLKESGELASLHMSEGNRIPLFMVDIQHLIMWSMLGHHAPFPPSRWYQLLKFNKLSHTVVLAVDGISVDDLQSADGLLCLPLPSCDDKSNASGSVSEKLFPWKLEFIGPLSYGSKLVQELVTVPLTNTQYDKVIKTYGSIEKALKGKAVYKVFRTMFPVQDESESVPKTEEEAKRKEGVFQHQTDKFPRTQLLLSADQMVQNGYPLPLVKTTSSGIKQPLVFPEEMQQQSKQKIANSLGTLIQSYEFQKNSNNRNLQKDSKSSGKGHNDLEIQENGNDDTVHEPKDEVYVFTKSLYKEVTPNSPMFGIDCEMCQTGINRSELTRISVVNEELEVVYERLVKPYRRITNYLTRFSGITEKMLRNVKTRLEDVQRDIRDSLPPDAILVGQSLNFDLHAMKMMHPYVIDTSVVYNLSGDRNRKTKLATLSRLFLSENIQCAGPKGHDSVEDALAAMKLVLLKLSKSVHYGDAILSAQVERQKEKEKYNQDIKYGKDSKNAKNSKDGEGSKEIENNKNSKDNKKCKEAKKTNRRKRIEQDLEIGDDGEKAYVASIFPHVSRGKHAAAVVAIQEAVSEYEAYYTTPEKTEKDHSDCGDSEGKSPHFQGFDHSSEVIAHACEIMSDYKLCIVHITKDSVGEKLKTLKKWCRKIVKSSAPFSLCIVVLGGTEKANGACLINLKRPTDEVLPILK